MEQEFRKLHRYGFIGNYGNNCEMLVTSLAGIEGDVWPFLIVGGCMRIGMLIGLCLAATVTSSMAQAAETITYTYDAKGRLVKVEHSGAVNNGVKVEYTHDKADNRKNLKVTGSP